MRIKLEVKPHSFASYIFHVLFPNASFINPVGLEVRQGIPTLFSLFLFSNNSVLRRDLTWHTKDRIIRSLMLPKTSLICLIILECLSQQDRLVLYMWFGSIKIRAPCYHTKAKRRRRIHVRIKQAMHLCIPSAR